MMMISNRPATLYSPEAAIAKAADINAADADWDYVVIHDPKGTGYSFIEIRDEDAEVIGYW